MDTNTKVYVYKIIVNGVVVTKVFKEKSEFDYIRESGTSSTSHNVKIIHATTVS